MVDRNTKIIEVERRDLRGRSPTLLLRRIASLFRRACLRLLGAKRFGLGCNDSTSRIDWEKRATELGAYSVIDTRHGPEEYEYVTKRQKEILFPLLAASMRGNRRGDALDYGCGAGRFTNDIADFVDDNVYGYDPTSNLLRLAIRHSDRVQFTNMETEVLSESRIGSYALIWICLVLGGLEEIEVQSLANKLRSALKDDGILFLVEATAEREKGSHWRIRTPEKLRMLFDGFDLELIDEYVDVDQRNSVIVGRKA